MHTAATTSSSSKRVKADGPIPVPKRRGRLEGSDSEEEADYLGPPGYLPSQGKDTPSADVSHRDAMFAFMTGIDGTSSPELPECFVASLKTRLARSYPPNFTISLFWSPFLPSLSGKPDLQQGNLLQELKGTSTRLGILSNLGNNYEAFSWTWHLQPRAIDECIRIWLSLDRNASDLRASMAKLFVLLTGWIESNQFAQSELAQLALVMRFAIAQNSRLNLATLPNERLRTIARTVFTDDGRFIKADGPCPVHMSALNDGFFRYMDSVDYASSKELRPKIIRLFTGLVRSILESETVLLEGNPGSHLATDTAASVVPSSAGASLNEAANHLKDMGRFERPLRSLSTNSGAVSRSSDVDTVDDEVVDLVRLEEVCRPPSTSRRFFTRFLLLGCLHKASQGARMLSTDLRSLPCFRDDMETFAETTVNAYLARLDDHAKKELLQEVSKEMNARDSISNFLFLLVNNHDATSKVMTPASASVNEASSTSVNEASSASTSEAALAPFGEEAHAPFGEEAHATFSEEAPAPIGRKAPASTQASSSVVSRLNLTRDAAVLKGFTAGNVFLVADAFFDNTRFMDCLALLNRHWKPSRRWCREDTQEIEVGELRGLIVFSNCQRRLFSTEKEDLSIARRTRYQDGTPCRLVTGTTDDVDSSRLQTQVKDVLRVHDFALSVLNRVCFSSEVARKHHRALILISRSQLLLEDRQIDAAEQDLATALGIFWEEHRPRWNHPDQLHAWWIHGRIYFRRAESQYVVLLNQARTSPRRSVDTVALQSAMALARYAISVYEKLEKEWTLLNQPKKLALVRQSHAKTRALLAELQVLKSSHNDDGAGREASRRLIRKAKENLKESVELTVSANLTRIQVYDHDHDCYQRGLHFIRLWSARLADLDKADCTSSKHSS